MRIWSLYRRVSAAVAAFILAFVLWMAPAGAQERAPVNNPGAQGVSEQQLLDELGKIQGRVTIPDRKATTLQQPQGRDYQTFERTALPWVGAFIIIGTLLSIVLFYLIRGRIRTQAGESGQKILRFNALERLLHWTTATAFIVLAITGLNLIFGKRLLMPLIGPEAFSTWSIWAKYAHHFVSWAFMLGVVLMLLTWIRHNLPDRYDARWLKSAGGFFDRSNQTHIPAGRFNTGQKLIFWSVVVGGAALSVSGVFMLFPFSFTDVNGMQMAQYVHAIAGLIMIAVIIGHIYIGTLGMEGAYQAMGSGSVDLNWAKEHHSAWVEEQQGKTGARTPPHTAAEPAE
ncbi:formate dehydrogenase subunit gamma [Sinorhizobium meliloti]|uniref:formate dehydrogenase subunit gamma n=1 Tax=Rhizobium meliloti TaxID=382 RepID=UPI00398CC27D